MSEIKVKPLKELAFKRNDANIESEIQLILNDEAKLHEFAEFWLNHAEVFEYITHYQLLSFINAEVDLTGREVQLVKQAMAGIVGVFSDAYEFIEARKQQAIEEEELKKQIESTEIRKKV